MRSRLISSRNEWQIILTPSVSTILPNTLNQGPGWFNFRPPRRTGTISIGANPSLVALSCNLLRQLLWMEEKDAAWSNMISFYSIFYSFINSVSHSMFYSMFYSTFYFLFCCQPNSLIYSQFCFLLCFQKPNADPSLNPNPNPNPNHKNMYQLALCPPLPPCSPHKITCQ